MTSGSVAITVGSELHRYDFDLEHGPNGWTATPAGELAPERTGTGGSPRAAMLSYLKNELDPDEL